MSSDVSVSLGVTGKDVVLGAFSEVGKAGHAMGETFGSIAGKLAGLAAGYVSITATIGAFHGAMEEGGRLADFSDQTGIAVGKLVLLERAFENNGLQADDMGKTINKMQKFLVAAGEAGSESADKLHKIGLFSSELLQLSPDEQFEKIAKTVAEIQDPAERAAVSMEIFGKSGGKLMALFKDMPGEIAKAKDEVGNYSSIMEKNAKAFDDMGDGITEIGHKLMEFAAGALSNVGGGLEVFIAALKNFDAAAFGEKVTKDLKMPLLALADSLMDGNFSQALEMAYELVKLQSMKMGNEFYKIISASVAAVGSFIQGAFSQDSYLLSYIQTAFSLVGNFISKALQNGMIGMLEGIPMFSSAVDTMKYKLETTNREIAQQQNTLATGWEVASTELAKVSQNAFSTAENVYKMSGGYFDVATQQERVQTMSEKIVSDHEALAALTATIAMNGKKYEESLVGVEQSYSQFKAIGGEAGNLGKMAGLNIPEKTYTGTGLGPIDVPSPFETKMVHGTKSVGKATDPLAEAMKNLLQASDYTAGSDSSQLTKASWSRLQDTMQSRASQQTASDFSYYTGGDSSASKEQTLNDLTSKYRSDGVPFAEARGKAEADFNAQMNGKLAGTGGTAGGSGSGSGSGGSSSKPEDPVSAMLGKILKALGGEANSFVEKICNERLPINVLA